MESGVYREQQVAPREGDVFQGVGDGTVLNGARLLEGWAADSAGWSVGGQTQGGIVHGPCRPEAPRCGHPEELFVDGERLRHVSSLAEVDQESWFFDYDADRIHIGTDPNGRTVETSVTPFAFRSDARGVVLRNLVVTHYATQSQYGTIHAEGPDWTIEQVTARDNHATGIFFVGDRAVVRDSRSIGNGQLGLGGTESADSRVERVEIADNNQNGFDDEWEGGRRQVHPHDQCRRHRLLRARQRRRRDLVRRERPGLDDHAATGRSTTPAPASSTRSASAAPITGNEVTGNGFGEAAKDWAWGAGIQVAASRGLTIERNQVSGNYQA